MVAQYGKDHCAKRIKIMSEHIDQVVDESDSIDKSIRSVLDDASTILKILCNDIIEGRVK